MAIGRYRRLDIVLPQRRLNCRGIIELGARIDYQKIFDRHPLSELITIKLVNCSFRWQTGLDILS